MAAAAARAATVEAVADDATRRHPHAPLVVEALQGHFPDGRYRTGANYPFARALCLHVVCDDVATHREEGTPAVNGLCSSPRPSIPSSSQKTRGCGFFGSSISTTTVARRTAHPRDTQSSKQDRASRSRLSALVRGFRCPRRACVAHAVRTGGFYTAEPYGVMCPRLHVYRLPPQTYTVQRDASAGDERRVASERGIIVQYIGIVAPFQPKSSGTCHERRCAHAQPGRR